MILLLTGVLILFIAAIPYLIFLIGISFGKKTTPAPYLMDLPSISILIPAYNEAAVIRKRIANIRGSDYPPEKYELVLVDDCSSDDTAAIAEEACRAEGINHRILRNDRRMGVNRTINRAIEEAHHTILVTTDADVIFDTQALSRLIFRLMSDENIAAVCGDLRPVPDEIYRTSRIEGTYRNFYGRMCAWESAVDSTYTLNGALIALKKELVPRIDDRRGADDANTGLEAIRRGYRAVYEMEAVVYEIIPEDFRSQFRQKTRRATHLIEATIDNMDLLKMNRPFSRIFYPLRIFMYLLTPALFFIGIIMFIAGIFLTHPLVAIALVIVFAGINLLWKSNIITAFATNQIYLLRGLFNLGKDMRIWESTSKKQ
jgi:cellulose synthase/poly-beta-1,6-N-acetylglucosamine synthase-like glycosyltransferase